MIRRPIATLFFALSLSVLQTHLARAADTIMGDTTVIQADATILQPGELFDLNNQC